MPALDARLLYLGSKSVDCTQVSGKPVPCLLTDASEVARLIGGGVASDVISRCVGASLQIGVAFERRNSATQAHASRLRPNLLRDRTARIFSWRTFFTHCGGILLLDLFNRACSTSGLTVEPCNVFVRTNILMPPAGLPTPPPPPRLPRSTVATTLCAVSPSTVKPGRRVDLYPLLKTFTRLHLQIPN